MKRIKLITKDVIFSGTADLMDHDAQKRICIGINIMCLSIILINSTVGTLAYFVTKQKPILSGISIEVFAGIIPLILNAYKKYRPASLVFFAIICSATCYFSCILGRSVESQLMIIYLIGVAIFLFDDRSVQILSVALSISIIIFVEWNFEHEFVKPVQIKPEVRTFMRWAVYGVVTLLVIITFTLYKKNNKILLKRLQQYNTEVEGNLQKEETKNKIKERFIGNATHEMKVSFHPIFSIINILYKVEKKAFVTDLKQSIDDLRAACGISKSIIDNILEYIKYEVGMGNIVRHQLVDLRVMVSKIIEIYKYIADERKVNITLSASSQLPQHILIDEFILRHIITNLLHNAIKFTRNGTTIYVRLELNLGELVISIEDHGEGIAEDQIKDIFKPFVTKNPEGLGLGLYIVQQLVSSLNGKIIVYKTSNQGTTFMLKLPHTKDLANFSQNQTLNYHN